MFDARRRPSPAGRSAWCRPRDRNCARAPPPAASPSRRAAWSRISSITSMPCGPPNPRKAVCEVLCVRQTKPVSSTAGSRYALSQWNMRAPQHRLGKIQAPAAVGIERDPHAFAAGRRASKPAAIARQERMALAGERHVERARQPHAHRPPGLPCAQRRDGRPRIGLHFLAAERAAHAQTLHRHLVARDSQARARPLPASRWDAAWRSAPPRRRFHPARRWRIAFPDRNAPARRSASSPSKRSGLDSITRQRRRAPAAADRNENFPPRWRLRW